MNIRLDKIIELGYLIVYHNVLYGYGQYIQSSLILNNDGS